jgi:hypothetical protein
MKRITLFAAVLLVAACSTGDRTADSANAMRDSAAPAMAPAPASDTGMKSDTGMARMDSAKKDTTKKP